MLVLILLDVQYLQNAGFSFEKVQTVKITPPQVPTTIQIEFPQQNFSFSSTEGRFPTVLNSIWKTLVRDMQWHTLSHGSSAILAI